MSPARLAPALAPASDGKIPPAGRIGALALLSGLFALAALALLPDGGWLIVLASLAFWISASALTATLARLEPTSPTGRRALSLLIPLVFGLTLLFLWEFAVRGLAVPSVLLPPPSASDSETAPDAPLVPRAD